MSFNKTVHCYSFQVQTARVSHVREYAGKLTKLFENNICLHRVFYVTKIKQNVSNESHVFWSLEVFYFVIYLL